MYTYIYTPTYTYIHIHIHIYNYISSGYSPTFQYFTVLVAYKNANLLPTHSAKSGYSIRSSRVTRVVTCESAVLVTSIYTYTHLYESTVHAPSCSIATAAVNSSIAAGAVKPVTCKSAEPRLSKVTCQWHLLDSQRQFHKGY